MFSCMAHSRHPGQYVALEFENGALKNRTLYRGAERKSLESLARSGDFTTVYADRRTDSHLLPFSFPSDAVQADLNVFRRAKSDEEIHALTRMATLLRTSHDHARSTEHFRGVAEKMEFEHGASEERRGDDLTLRRYGLKDAYGRCVELSSIVPHTEEWRGRVERIHRGCDAVVAMIAEGVSGDAVDAAFRGHLDPKLDVIYGGVLHHTGYEPWERSLDVDVLRQHDVCTVCPIVGDYRGQWAPLMHSVHAVGDGATTYRGDEGDFTDLSAQYYESMSIAEVSAKLNEINARAKGVTSLFNTYRQLPKGLLLKIDEFFTERIEKFVDGSDADALSRVISSHATNVPKPNVLYTLFAAQTINESTDLPARDDLITEIVSRYDLLSEFKKGKIPILIGNAPPDDAMKIKIQTLLERKTDKLLKDDEPTNVPEFSLTRLDETYHLDTAFDDSPLEGTLEGAQSNATIWTRVTHISVNRNPIALTDNIVHQTLTSSLGDTLGTIQRNFSDRDIDIMNPDYVPGDFVYGTPYTTSQAEKVSQAWVDKLKNDIVKLFDPGAVNEVNEKIESIMRNWNEKNSGKIPLETRYRMYRTLLSGEQVKDSISKDIFSHDFLTTVLPVEIGDDLYSAEIVSSPFDELVPTISIPVSKEIIEKKLSASVPNISLVDCGIEGPIYLPSDTVVHLFSEVEIHGRMMMSAHRRAYCTETKNSVTSGNTVRNVAVRTLESLRELNGLSKVVHEFRDNPAWIRERLDKLAVAQDSILRLMDDIFNVTSYPMKQMTAVRTLYVISHVISQTLCDAWRNNPKEQGTGYYHIDPNVAKLTAPCGRVSAIQIDAGTEAEHTEKMHDNIIQQPESTDARVGAKDFEDMIEKLIVWRPKT